MNSDCPLDPETLRAIDSARQTAITNMTNALKEKAKQMEETIRARERAGESADDLRAELTRLEDGLRLAAVQLAQMNAALSQMGCSAETDFAVTK